ncbi:MAG: hypothetical protein AB4038_21120 [Prochloraceae cyanobacterium]
MRNLNLRNLPAWIPNVNAWMSSILLVLLLQGISIFLKTIFPLEQFLIILPPKLRSILYVLTLLSPILIIAVAHHWLHFFLDRFFPETRSPELGKIEGFIPGLMSWWEGLYGWLAIYVSSFIITIVSIILFSSYNSTLDLFYDLLNWWDVIKGWFTLPNITRLVTISYLYQFENIVRNHLLCVAGDHDKRA